MRAVRSVFVPVSGGVVFGELGVAGGEGLISLPAHP